MRPLPPHSQYPCIFSSRRATANGVPAPENGPPPMAFVKRKDGKNYLIQSIRRPDGRRGQKMLAYLGQALSLEERIDDLDELRLIEVGLAEILWRKAAKAKAKFTAQKWVPLKEWAVTWEDGMPTPFHARWMPEYVAGLIYDYWSARVEASLAEKRAAKEQVRLDKLRAVAADLERAGAGAG